MTKTPKKRKKAYRGPDAASSGPRIVRYSVKEESAAATWWKEHQRVVLFRGFLVCLAMLISWIIYSIIN